MKIIYTEQALFSLEEVLNFLAPKVSQEKLYEIRGEILDAAEQLLINPLQGQEEPYLKNMGLGHRRLVVSHYKIIYRVIYDCIFITDIFDTRQDPDKMRG